jgi:hypothetical protein
VSADAVIMLLAAPACVVYAILTRRSIRIMRAGDEEWRRRWRQLDSGRRRSIRQRMKRGEAVPDREDAELALRAMAQANYIRKANAPPMLASMLLVLAGFVAGAAAGSTILKPRCPNENALSSGEILHARGRVNPTGVEGSGKRSARISPGADRIHLCPGWLGLLGTA